MKYGIKISIHNSSCEMKKHDEKLDIDPIKSKILNCDIFTMKDNILERAAQTAQCHRPKVKGSCRKLVLLTMSFLRTAALQGDLKQAV